MDKEEAGILYLARKAVLFLYENKIISAEEWLTIVKRIANREKKQ